MIAWKEGEPGDKGLYVYVSSDVKWREGMRNIYPPSPLPICYQYNSPSPCMLYPVVSADVREDELQAYCTAGTDVTIIVRTLNSSFH